MPSMTTAKASLTAAADLQEVILLAAIYYGVPATNRAFSVAGDILREKGLLAGGA